MDAKTIISLVASVNTIIAMRMAGRGDQRFNIVGLVNCVIWMAFTFVTQAWGLIFLNVVLAHTYTTNIIRWRKNG